MTWVGHRLVPGHLWVIIRPSGGSRRLHDRSVIRGSSGGHLGVLGGWRSGHEV